jgi:Thioredoxin
VANTIVSAQQPGLVFFYSQTEGACRRAEAFLAQGLQHHRNHGTFKLYRVEEQERPDLFQRFRISMLPTLVVVEGKTVSARLERREVGDHGHIPPPLSRRASVSVQGGPVPDARHRGDDHVS